MQLSPNSSICQNLISPMDFIFVRFIINQTVPNIQFKNIHLNQSVCQESITEVGCQYVCLYDRWMDGWVDGY